LFEDYGFAVRSVKRADACIRIKQLQFGVMVCGHCIGNLALLNHMTMETADHNSNGQGQNPDSNHRSHVAATNEDETTNTQAPSRNQDAVDAQRGDNDDFTTNGLDQANTMRNDDNPADARESGTK